jgi:hypothetical protein
MTKKMKANIKNIILVALMFGTLIGYANENKKSTEVDDNVKIIFKSVKKGQNLTIANEQGQTIYKEKIKSSGNYSRVFNLKNLKDGLYTTELNKDFESVITQIKVVNGKASFLHDNKKKIFKPVIRKQGNLLFISKIDFNKAPLKISLYYKGDLIYFETVKRNKNDVLNKVYKLSDIETGNYKVIVSTDNKVYTEDFTI